MVGDFKKSFETFTFLVLTTSQMVGTKEDTFFFFKLLSRVKHWPSLAVFKVDEGLPDAFAIIKGWNMHIVQPD